MCTTNDAMPGTSFFAVRPAPEMLPFEHMEYVAMNCRLSPKLKPLGFLVATLLSIGTSTHSLLAQAVSLIQTSTRAVGTGAAGFSGDFGSDTSLSLTTPSYVILDTLGNLYISDTGNNCVRKVDLFGNVTTIAGLVVTGQGDTCNTATNTSPTTAQGLLQPTGLALDSNNNLYIADSGHNCIRRLTAGTTGTANLTAVAGTCSTTAALSSTPAPSGLVIDTSNNLYVALQYTDPVAALDVYQVVRQSITPSNTVAVNKATMCLVAGTASALVATTCTGITNSVVLAAPSGLALDASLNVYVADTGNNCVREVVGTTPQSTTVGQCANDGTGTTATAISQPFGIAFSKINTLFISQTNPNNVYKYNSQSTALTLAAGLPSGAAGTYTSANDGVSALNINLHSPKGIVFDNNNNFYLVDSLNNIVRYLNINYIFSQTPVGSKSVAQPLTYIINKPSVNLNINVGTDYVISNNQCVGTFSVAAAGNPPTTCQVFVQFAPTRPGTRNSPITLMDTVSNTLVATGMQGIGTGSLGAFVPGTVMTLAAGLKAPTAVSTNSAGNAYVLEAGTTPGSADIRIITPSGNSTQVSVGQGTGLITPTGIASDAAGNWYIVDAAQGTVSRFGADGTINTKYVTGLVSPSAIFVDGYGNLYIAQQGTAHNVIEVYASGLRRVVAGSGTDTAANGVVATNAKFSLPTGLFIDLNGILYISDANLHRVFAVDTLNLIHLLAGNGTTTTTNASTALGTAIVDPTSITVDAAGDVYIADSSDNKVFAIYATAATGANISTVIGNGTAGNTGDNGPSTAATVSGPLSVALDGSGDLFIVDSGNSSLREILYPSPTISFGRVAVGSTSAVMTQGFANLGTISLNLSGPITTTDNHFSVSPSPITTCGTAILSGQVCAIGYTFTPTTTSAYTAFSNLVSNAYTSTNVVTLTANGALPLPISSSNGATETEVYGSPFPETTALTPGSNPPVTGTLTYSVGSQTLCTITGTLSPSSTCNAPNSGLSVGTYTVTVTYSGDANYAPTTFTVSLQVTPAPLTVTTDNKSRPYGTANPTLTGSISGVTNGDTITASYSTTAVITSAPGTYPITAALTPGATTSLSNYSITNNGGTLTVTANSTAVVTVAVNCATKIYGALNPAFTSTVTGALNGDTFTITYSTTATTTSPVGTYPITATVTGPATANYTTITVTPCTLSVIPAPTTTVLTSSGSPSLFGSAVTLTATVAAPGSTITPGGSVSFYTGNGATLLGTGQLNASGVATITTTTLPVGTDVLTAVYPASTNYNGSIGTLTQQVTVPTGAFIITATPNFQLVYGAATTAYNVTVTSTGGFIGPVALTCSGQPTDGSCSFAAPTVQVSTTTPGMTTLTVVNTAADAALRMPGIPGAPQQNSSALAGMSWPFALGALALLVAAAGLRKRGKHARGLVLMLLLMFGLAAGAIGCGCPPTAYRTYTIVVTGTSVNGGPAAQTTSVQLAVGTH